MKTPELDLMPMSENGEKEFEKLKEGYVDMLALIKKIHEFYEYTDCFAHHADINIILKKYGRL